MNYRIVKAYVVKGSNNSLNPQVKFRLIIILTKFTA